MNNTLIELLNNCSGLSVEELAKRLEEFFANRILNLGYAYPKYQYPPVEVPTYHATPHRCPICGGTGIVSGGFYNSVGGYGTSTIATEPCRQCGGKGLVWS